MARHDTSDPRDDSTAPPSEREQAAEHADTQRASHELQQAESGDKAARDVDALENAPEHNR